jgi:putative transposase
VLIEPGHSILSIRRQCELFGLPRGSYYFEPKPKVSEEDKIIMDEIDRIYTKCPFYGRAKITAHLNRQGYKVNHKRIYRLMGVLGIEAVRPTPDTSKPNVSHAIYPYLLKNTQITQTNQIWGVDITYVRLKKEWLYLVALLDWYSRYILSWELSDTLTNLFCYEALTRALKQALPEIHNSDQGSQFTSNSYIDILKAHPSIKISMDHRGRCFDNIFTERLWRTIKYEEVYLKEYTSPREARQSLSAYIQFYNKERLHQSLNYKTPAEIYYEKDR